MLTNNDLKHGTEVIVTKKDAELTFFQAIL